MHYTIVREGDQSVPYIFEDDEMQAIFQNNFFRRLVTRGRSFYLENFTTLPEVFEVFEFQGWNHFLTISKDIYTRLVPAFYRTLIPFDEDNTSFQGIVGSFELQVLPSNIAQITNTPNDGILCRAGKRWWEEIGAIEEEVSKVLTRKRSMHVKDIRTSHLLISVRAVYSVVQQTVLSQVVTLML